MIISSHANQLIKKIRKLRLSKYRNASGEFFIEGAKFVSEAMECGWDIQHLVVAPEMIKSEFANKIIATASSGGIEIIEVSNSVFDTIASKDLVQGIGATVRIQPRQELPTMKKNDLWVCLEGVQDPGNLGTILRTSDAAGANGVILIGDCVDQYDPSVIRSSMGAFFCQPIIKASLGEIENWKKKHRVTCVGTSDQATTMYDNVPYALPTLIMMGSEREGLSNKTSSVCDMFVGIPMMGRCDSLNLAVATGIMLYEVVRITKHSVNREIL